MNEPAAVAQSIASLQDAARLVLPEIVLLATVCIDFFAAPFLVDDRGEGSPGLRHRCGWLSLVAVGLAAWFWIGAGPEPVGRGPFRLDELTWFVRGLTLVGAAVLVLVGWNQIEDGRSCEAHACLLAIVAGVNLIAAANDLAALFLALELVSIPTYLWLLLPRRDERAREAVLKYFLLSILSSAVTAYGLSFLYGTTGTTNLAAWHAALGARPEAGVPVLTVVGGALVLAGLSFRITAVPFHFYAPDVFQGAPLAPVAMLSFVPKVAGFAALLRLLIVPSAAAESVEAAGSWSLQTTAMLWWLSVVTMCVGNLMALMQDDVRRLLAWSSVAHAGYMLLGLAVGPRTGAAVDGVEALLFYLAVYGAMTVGAFAVLAAVGRTDRPIARIDDLAGLGRSRPGPALALALFLFSLVGLPPTAGFLGKLNLFLAAWGNGTEAGRQLAACLAVNAAVGAWYYLRVVGTMYLKDPAPGSEEGPRETPSLVASVLCAAAVVLLFFAPGWLLAAVSRI